MKMKDFQEKGAALFLASLPLVALILYGLLSTVGLLSGGAWGGIGIGGSLLLALLYGIGNKRLPTPHGLVALFVLFMLSASLLSCCQSLTPQAAGWETLKLATILIPLLVLFAPSLQEACLLPQHWLFLLVLLLLLGLGMHNGLLFYFIEEKGGQSASVTKLNRGLSYGLLFLWPVVAALWGARDLQKKKGFLLWALFLSVALALTLTRSRASQAGLVVAAGTLGLAWLAPRVTIGLWGLVGIGSSAWPIVAQYAVYHWHNLVVKLPPSWGHRVEIWDYLSYRIFERPLLGWGIGQAGRLDWRVPHGDMYVYTRQTAAHPHNAVVQLWVELGAWGLGLYFFLFFLTLYGASRLRPPLRPFALAAIAFAYVLLMSAYDFWTDSLWAAMALTAFAFTVMPFQKNAKLRDH